uniref:Uncharacterized protein n=1 Tax=Micrurus surinamensis TaxID=129470 RepID=A0A2D4PUY9_MICSU
MPFWSFAILSPPQLTFDTLFLILLARHVQSDVGPYGAGFTGGKETKVKQVFPEPARTKMPCSWVYGAGLATVKSRVGIKAQSSLSEPDWSKGCSLSRPSGRG